jgi:uncharacterized protein DUF3551
MRLALIAAFALIWGGAAIAQDFTTAPYCDPWCTEGWGGGLDCSYRNFDQCLVSTRGTGSHCRENPFLSMCTRPGVAQKPLRPHPRRR